jgi:hypothetical protein
LADIQGFGNVGLDRFFEQETGDPDQRAEKMTICHVDRFTAGAFLTVCYKTNDLVGHNRG